MANKRLTANKEQEDGVTVRWRYLYNLCKPIAESAQPLTGVVDGANVVFTAPHQDLMDANGNVAQVADFTAYANGIAVTVASIDAQKGEVTLSVAPTSETMTADYSRCDKNHHAEIIVQASEMTDKEDAAEAGTLADAHAATRRSGWISALASEPVKVNQPAQEADVVL